MTTQAKKNKYKDRHLVLSKKTSNLYSILFSLLFLLEMHGYASDTKFIEFQHFWISPGEKAALSLIEDKFQKSHGEWKEFSSLDYEIMKQAFMQRITAGFPPSSLWLGGEDIQSFYSLGILEEISKISNNKEWKKNIYDFTFKLRKTGNPIIALPITIHNENWAWYNTTIYQKLNLPIPKNWDTFIQQAPLIQKAGYTPLAISEQDWDIRLLFTTIVAGVAGKTLYNRLYIDEDLTVFKHQKIQRALSIFSKLRAYKPLPRQVKTWNQATNMLTYGRAAMQIMGDWVRGDFLASGIDVSKTIVCTTPPEADNLFIAAVDFIAFPIVNNKKEKAGQELLVNTILDKDLQIRFSKLKGSIPILKNIQASQLNSCAAKSLPYLSNKQQRLLSPRMTMNENLRVAIQNILVEFWNNTDMTVKQVTSQLKHLNNK